MATGIIERVFRAANSAFTSLAWGDQNKSIGLTKLAHDVDVVIDADNPLPISDEVSRATLTQMLARLSMTPAGTPADPQYSIPLPGNHQLASNIPLAIAGVTPPVTIVVGGTYAWDYVATAWGGGTVSLQVLQSDGATWRVLATANANGAQGVGLGDGAVVRLAGSVAALAGLSSSLA